MLLHGTNACPRFIRHRHGAKHIAQRLQSTTVAKQTVAAHSCHMTTAFVFSHGLWRTTDHSMPPHTDFMTYPWFTHTVSLPHSSQWHSSIGIRPCKKPPRTTRAMRRCAAGVANKRGPCMQSVDNVSSTSAAEGRWHGQRLRGSCRPACRSGTFPCC